MTLALTVRQPWTWLEAHGYKDVENRTWATGHRGLLLLHAAKGMTRDEYEICQGNARLRGVEIPQMNELERGGIVGYATLVDCARWASGKWFQGPIGWVLKDAHPLPFFPCPGQIQLFEVPYTIEELLVGVAVKA